MGELLDLNTMRQKRESAELDKREKAIRAVRELRGQVNLAEILGIDRCPDACDEVPSNRLLYRSFRDVFMAASGEVKSG